MSKLEDNIFNLKCFMNTTDQELGYHFFSSLFIYIYIYKV